MMITARLAPKAPDTWAESPLKNSSARTASLATANRAGVKSQFDVWVELRSCSGGFSERR